MAGRARAVRGFAWRWAVLAASMSACHAMTITAVECGTDADCMEAGNLRCSSDHTCVPAVAVAPEASTNVAPADAMAEPAIESTDAPAEGSTDAADAADGETPSRP